MQNIELENFMHAIAAFERQNGRVPSIAELAETLGVKLHRVRRLIKKYLLSDKIDGACVFNESLNEALSPVCNIPTDLRFTKLRQPHEQDANHVNENKYRKRFTTLEIKYPVANADYLSTLEKAVELLESERKILISVVRCENTSADSKEIVELINDFANDLDEDAVWRADPTITEDGAFLKIYHKAGRKRTK